MGALRDFVADLLESEGAAIDPIEPDGLDVVAPASVRTAMGWPELVRLGFSAQRPEGAMPVGLEGDWLDRFGALLGSRGRFAERELVVPEDTAVPSDPMRLLDRAFDLPNATWRLHDAAPAWTRCLVLTFHYIAVSDEKREGLFRLAINCGTSAALPDDLLNRLRDLAARDTPWRAPNPPVRRAAGAAWDATTLAARCRPLIEHHARRELASFLRAMQRRLDRDRGRIYEYHNDLRRSAQVKLAALGPASGDKVEADRRRETMRISAIEREFAAKLDDLRHNYALRVTVDWVQGLLLVAPVQRYEVLIKRRKGERLVRIDWHRAARSLEPPPCDWGVGLDRVRLVCDERLHLTDLAGQAPCAVCGKAWCRACWPESCPRCAATRDAARTGEGGMRGAGETRSVTL